MYRNKINLNLQKLIFKQINKVPMRLKWNLVVLKIKKIILQRNKNILNKLKIINYQLEK